MRPCIVRALALSLVALQTAASQLVSPRTVPVHQEEQFQIYPASRPGLGGVSIALDDTLQDPFVNPAKATRLKGFTLTTAPYSHGISGNRGGGRTLPIGFMVSSGPWSGAVLGALQQLDRAGPVWNRPTSERTATNQYFTGALAHRLDSTLSIGVSAFRAELSAIDGVDLLYAGSDRIDQSGSVIDLRVGAIKQWAPGHVLEAMVLHNSTDMRHDVHFTTNTWDNMRRVSVMTQRQEVNLDQTNIWGAHTEYMRPVGVEGWRVGALATLNRISHPKIPNYVIQNIPRDPGTTNSFNAGLGAARMSGPFTFGIDVILEPMSSDTWADAATATTRTDGSIIPAGEKTIENHFTFRNSKARIGVGRTWGQDTASHGALTADLGLSVYAISYDLIQTNNILRTTRRQHENWVESGPSFGLRFSSNDITVSYLFRVSCGSDGCDLLPTGGDNVFLASASVPGARGIIAAPSSPLFFRSGSERSHHFTISVPIR